MSEIIYFRNYDGKKIEAKSFKYDKNDKELVDFFNDLAGECVEGRVSTVKTIYTEDDQFIGYYAIAMFYVEAGELYDEKRVTSFPHPAIKLGRLLVDKDFRKKGIGSAVIAQIVMVSQTMNKFVACRFIVVDSKSDSVNFYKKRGFLEMENKKRKRKETVQMLFDLKE